MEATGVYHENLAWFLYERKKQVYIVLPNQAKAFFKSENMKSKTDKIDAQGLAAMSLSKALPLWKPVSPLIHQLRSQSRQYSSLQKELTRFANQLHALEHSYRPDPLVVKQLKKTIVFLEKQLEQLRKEMEKLAKTDPGLWRKLGYLTSIHGVGLLTAIVVVAETNGFALFRNQKQLTSFAGYDVVENQSGNRAGKTHISKKGNTHIRRILYMPAFHAVRPKGAFEKLYQSVYEKTKIKMKAYTAVQRKLLCLMYTLWKKEEYFDAQYSKPKEVEEPTAPLHEIVLV